MKKLLVLPFFTVLSVFGQQKPKGILYGDTANLSPREPFVSRCFEDSFLLLPYDSLLRFRGVAYSFESDSKFGVLKRYRAVAATKEELNRWDNQRRDTMEVISFWVIQRTACCDYYAKKDFPSGTMGEIGDHVIQSIRLTDPKRMKKLYFLFKKF
jgi:hypothetical protein